MVSLLGARHLPAPQPRVAQVEQETDLLGRGQLRQQALVSGNRGSVIVAGGGVLPGLAQGRPVIIMALHGLLLSSSLHLPSPSLI